MAKRKPYRGSMTFTTDPATLAAFNAMIRDSMEKAMAEFMAKTALGPADADRS